MLIKLVSSIVFGVVVVLHFIYDEINNGFLLEATV